MRVSDRLFSLVRVILVRLNHRRVLTRLRKAAGRRKLKVVFLVSELVKWKCQSVFERLRASDAFEPVVAVHNLTRLSGEPIEEQRRLVAEKMEYFRGRGMEVVDIQKYGSKHTLTASEIGADIVFYQQPWDLSRELRPWVVARRALTFYVPYYTPSSLMPSLEVGHKVLHLLFGQVVWNRSTVSVYRDLRRRSGGAYTTRYLPFGHPSLDEIRLSETASADGCVIYAPHFSIPGKGFDPPLRYATFHWNGREILAYARAHPEIKWVFKPHPSLRKALETSGLMTKEEADRYYREWERVGRGCYGSPEEYLRLFDESRAMVTDCGSFLTEYGCTGKPVIRLVSRDLNVIPHPAVAAIYRSYYEVRNLTEMESVFRRVLVNGEDPMRRERLAAVRAAGISGGDAAGKLTECLLRLCRRGKL